MIELHNIYHFKIINNIFRLMLKWELFISIKEGFSKTTFLFIDWTLYWTNIWQRLQTRCDIRLDIWSILLDIWSRYPVSRIKDIKTPDIPVHP